jgi:hypothetical protein
VTIGKVAARCARCGGEEFVQAMRKREERIDRLFCRACGAEHYYTELLRQIALEVIARSERALAEAQSLRKGHASRGANELLLKK